MTTDGEFGVLSVCRLKPQVFFPVVNVAYDDVSTTYIYSHVPKIILMGPVLTYLGWCKGP